MHVHHIHFEKRQQTINAKKAVEQREFQLSKIFISAPFEIKAKMWLKELASGFNVVVVSIKTTSPSSKPCQQLTANAA